jgi:hypothetical protein
MTIEEKLLQTREGFFSTITPSGAGFVDLFDGPQAFVLPSLIRRMALCPGDRVLCRVVPNFPDRISKRVPWRVVHASILERASGEVHGASVDQIAERMLVFLEDHGGAWTTDELATEMGALEERFVLEALLRLEERGQVSSARLQRSRVGGGRDVETFWSSDYGSLLPVGAFEDDGDEGDEA